MSVFSRNTAISETKGNGWKSKKTDKASKREKGKSKRY